MRRTISFRYLLYMEFILVILNTGCLNTELLPQKDEEVCIDFIPVLPPLGWPNLENTGITIQEKDLSSDLSALSITAAGYSVGDNEVIENLDINGRLILNGNNIIIRNCRIWGDSVNDSIGIQVISGHNIKIENNIIGKDCNNWPNSMTGISVGNNTDVTSIIKSNYIRYVEDGIFIGFNPYATASNCSYSLEIVDNYLTYIHAYNLNKPLEDPAQYKGDGIEALGSITRAIIDHNSFDVPGEQNSCIQVSPQWASIVSVVINNNWFNGGSISLRIRDTDLLDERIISDTTVTNNRFGNSYKYGPWNHENTVIEIIEGNVWNDTGVLIEGMNE